MKIHNEEKCFKQAQKSEKEMLELLRVLLICHALIGTALAKHGKGDLV